MRLRRDLIGTYLIMLGGLAVGLYAGIAWFDTTPAFTGWCFGAGTGLAGAAAILALTTNIPLAGRARPQHMAHTTDDDIDDEPPLDDAGVPL